MTLRLMTVRVDGDPDPDRAQIVLAVTEAGLLVTDASDPQARLQVVPASSCRLSAVYLAQDEREWWARLRSAGEEHAHG